MVMDQWNRFLQFLQPHTSTLHYAMWDQLDICLLVVVRIYLVPLICGSVCYFKTLLHPNSKGFNISIQHTRLSLPVVDFLKLKKRTGLFCLKLIVRVTSKGDRRTLFMNHLGVQVFDKCVYLTSTAYIGFINCAFKTAVIYLRLL